MELNVICADITTLAVDAPQTCAFAALLLEKLGDLAKMVGREEESEPWYEKSRDLIDRFVKRFWNGERFVAYDHYQPDRVIDVECLQFYYPLILGKRLPGEIIDRMAEDLEEGKGYLMPGGLAAMNQLSLPEGTGFSPFTFLPADQIIVVTGLYMAGKKELARKAAKFYMDGLGKTPNYYYSNGFTGSWAAAAFQVLANIYSNM